MKIKVRRFTLYTGHGGGFFRLFGVGLGWKDTRRVPLSFSERNGYKRHLSIGWLSIALLT